MADREYPNRPVVGVSGVVVLQGGGIVLVQRRHPPLQGQWSLPGGVLELGESMVQGLVREVREETGLVVVPGPLIDIIEHVERDVDGRIRYHYIVVNYVCRGGSESPKAAEDALAVAVVSPADLGSYQLASRTVDIIHRALRLEAGMRR